jgi:thiazole/oxazole-forming peptide maturase SagD family component
LKTIDSPQTGILRSANLANLGRFMPKFFSLAADMSEVQRLIGINKDIQYHVSGYGILFEEAFIRIIAEAIERYCIMIYPNLIENEIVYSSYNDLQRKGEDLPQFEYFQLYDSSYYTRKNHNLIRPSPNDVIGWIRGVSLFSNKELMVPAQMAFPGYKIHHDKGEKRWTLGFSTGAASGLTYTDALISAITEIIEIDAFSINWYTERQSNLISIKETILDDIIAQIFNNTDFEPTLMYHSLGDVNVHTISTFLINKSGQLPAISVGSQSSLDPIHCAYRSILEAGAVSLLGTIGYIYQPDLFTSYKDYSNISNLDSNVAFYSSPDNYQLGIHLIDKLTDSKLLRLNTLENYKDKNKEKNLMYLIKELMNISKYATAFNVTTPDIETLGFRVVKVFVPEMMFMSLPSYPYTNHPRMKKYGGVKNKYPHPLP